MNTSLNRERNLLLHIAGLDTERQENMFRKALIGRDPAMALLMGASAGSDFGGDFGDDMGFGDDDFGDDEFGDDFAGFGHHGHRHHVPKPTAHQAMQAWHAHHARKHHNNKRIAKLDPNMHATTKVERYSFTLSQDVTLGTVTAFTSAAMSSAPDTTFRPQILTSNPPIPGFAYMTSLRMANVNVSVGSGSEDLFNYSAYATLRELDMPTLTPANKATVTGTTTAVVPPAYLSAATYTLTVNFKGPSLLAGGSAM